MQTAETLAVFTQMLLRKQRLTLLLGEFMCHWMPLEPDGNIWSHSHKLPQLGFLPLLCSACFGGEIHGV